MSCQRELSTLCKPWYSIDYFDRHVWEMNSWTDRGRDPAYIYVVQLAREKPEFPMIGQINVLVIVNALLSTIHEAVWPSVAIGGSTLHHVLVIVSKWHIYTTLGEIQWR